MNLWNARSCASSLFREKITSHCFLSNDEGDTDEESRVFLYRYLETEGEEPQLENIDDDEEFEIVADAYDEWLDAQEYEALDLDALGLDSLE